MTRVTIVSGLSGAGKSVALHTLEDEGFFCIDNLPSHLLSQTIDKLLDSDSTLYEYLAIGVDIRSERASPDNMLKLLDELKLRENTDVEVLFLGHRSFNSGQTFF